MDRVGSLREPDRRGSSLSGKARTRRVAASTSLGDSSSGGRAPPPAAAAVAARLERGAADKRRRGAASFLYARCQSTAVAAPLVSLSVSRRGAAQRDAACAVSLSPSFFFSLKLASLFFGESLSLESHAFVGCVRCVRVRGAFDTNIYIHIYRESNAREDLITTTTTKPLRKRCANGKSGGATTDRLPV